MTRNVLLGAVPICLAIFVGLLIGSIFEIFDDPSSRTSAVIREHGTYLGAVIALFAALITVGGIYAAALRPIVEENRRVAEKRKIDETVGATLIEVAATEVMAALAFRTHKLEKDKDYAIEAIPVPEPLRSFEVISTQSLATSKLIAKTLNRVSIVNGLHGHRYIDDEKRQNMLTQLEIGTDDCKQLLQNLSGTTSGEVIKFQRPR